MKYPAYRFQREQNKKLYMITLLSIITSVILFLTSASCLLFLKVDQPLKKSLLDAYENDVDFMNGKTLFKNTTIKRCKNNNPSLVASRVKSMENPEFMMQSGASIRLNEATGMRFKAYVGDTLAREVSETEKKTFGIIIAPAFYFEKALSLATEGEAYDYVTLLNRLVEEYGAKPALRLRCEPVEENGRKIIQGSVVSILYKNTNLAYTAAAYVETISETGDVSYSYADYPDDCLSMARSVSYIANAALNDKPDIYSEEQKEVLRGFLDRSIDYAASLTEEESGKIIKRELTLTFTDLSNETLQIGDNITFVIHAVVDYKGNAETTDKRVVTIPLYWESSDSSVLKFSGAGVAAVLAEGTVSVSASFGETSVTRELRCGNTIYRKCEIRDASGYDRLVEIVPQTAEIKEGELFKSTIRVTDYAGYGELSFWLDGTLCTTENGSYVFSRTITADTVVELTNISSALNYFVIENTSLTIKNEANFRKNLPTKIVLPALAKDGKTVLKTLKQYTLNDRTGKIVCVNLRDLIIPQSYTTIPEDSFKYCSALETIKLYNTSLSGMSNTLKTNWTGCTALKNIYVPAEALQAYCDSKYWSSKNEFWKDNTHLKELPAL